jgi:hypothetical protein
MQMTKVRELRKEWGNKPCDHPDYDREYYLGSHTGDYVCTTCGRVMDDDVVAERQKEAEKKMREEIDARTAQRKKETPE